MLPGAALRRGRGADGARDAVHVRAQLRRSLDPRRAQARKDATERTPQPQPRLIVTPGSSLGRFEHACRQGR